MVKVFPFGALPLVQSLQCGCMSVFLGPSLASTFRCLPQKCDLLPQKPSSSLISSRANVDSKGRVLFLDIPLFHGLLEEMYMKEKPKLSPPILLRGHIFGNVVDGDLAWPGLQNFYLLDKAALLGAFSNWVFLCGGKQVL